MNESDFDFGVRIVRVLYRLVSKEQSGGSRFRKNLIRSDRRLTRSPVKFVLFAHNEASVIAATLSWPETAASLCRSSAERTNGWNSSSESTTSDVSRLQVDNSPSVIPRRTQEFAQSPWKVNFGRDNGCEEVEC